MSQNLPKGVAWIPGHSDFEYDFPLHEVAAVVSLPSIVRGMAQHTDTGKFMVAVHDLFDEFERAFDGMVYKNEISFHCHPGEEMRFVTRKLSSLAKSCPSAMVKVDSKAKDGGHLFVGNLEVDTLSITWTVSRGLVSFEMELHDGPLLRSLGGAMPLDRFNWAAHFPLDEPKTPTGRPQLGMFGGEDEEGVDLADPNGRGAPGDLAYRDVAAWCTKRQFRRVSEGNYRLEGAPLETPNGNKYLWALHQMLHMRHDTVTTEVKAGLKAGKVPVKKGRKGKPYMGEPTQLSMRGIYEGFVSWGGPAMPAVISYMTQNDQDKSFTAHVILLRAGQAKSADEVAGLYRRIEQSAERGVSFESQQHVDRGRQIIESLYRDLRTLIG